MRIRRQLSDMQESMDILRKEVKEKLVIKETSFLAEKKLMECKRRVSQLQLQINRRRLVWCVH
jgi:hypothetical protein